MATIALCITLRTRPGQRDAVRDIWMKHMAPAIQANPGHLAYFYTFHNDEPDTIYAFQHYASEQAAREFLNHPAYLAYLAESRDLLEHAPSIASLVPQWVKSAD